MNRITTNITLQKCLFCCFRCATWLWHFRINYHSCVTYYLLF